MTDVRETEEDFWHVQLPSGEVRYYSLEELDEAFQRDEIGAETYVLKQGETSWMRLGELLGLDDAPAEASVVIARSVPPGAGPETIAPAAAASFAPPSIPPASFGGNDYGAVSIRPVVADVDDLDDDVLAASMKPKKKKMAFVAGGAALALVLGIVGITSASSGSEQKVAAAAPPPVVAPIVEAAPAPAPQATLSDDMKKSLLEADKAREAKAAAKAAENAKYRSKTASSYRAPKSGQVFHKGGNKYDPLNSAL